MPPLADAAAVFGFGWRFRWLGMVQAAFGTGGGGFQACLARRFRFWAVAANKRPLLIEADAQNTLSDEFINDIHRLLTRAQDKGEIAADKDIRALARFLTSTVNGIMVMGKADPDRARLEDIARTALKVLD